MAVMTTTERAALLSALERNLEIKARFPQFWRVRRYEGDALRELARSVGINVTAIRERATRSRASAGAERAEPAAAFKGTLRFPMRIDALGEVATRRARVRWWYTPEWDYCDPAGGRVVASPGESYTLVGEVATETYGDADDLLVLDDGRIRRLRIVEWKPLGFLSEGLLSDALIERIFAMIDEDAQAQDRKRRAKSVS